MKRFFACLLTFCLALTAIPAFAMLTVSISDISVQAGEEIFIWYNLPEDGQAALSLINEAGQTVAVLFDEWQAAGSYEYGWTGTSGRDALPSGSYDLELRQGAGAVRLKLMLDHPTAPQGTVAIPEATDTPAVAEPEPTAAPQPVSTAEQPFNPTPALRSAYSHVHEPGTCYWCTPMDITDEETVWKMLTSPIYTLNEEQMKQVIVREEPSEDSKGIAVVTGTSEGVHVLENRKDGWSKIECYSSSFFDSEVKAWNEFVTGYVKTSLIQKKTPDQEYALLVDKLTQTLYIFHEGHLLSTLAVCTGLYNQKQPYNETRTGEFILVSRTGDLKSDRMTSRYAIRYNAADYIHEVPHVKNADKSLNYKATEYKLGTRGSHGCIRVQRLTNPDGINMKWLSEHVYVSSKKGSRLVIWEDFQGRQIPIPSDDTPLYYNPKGGKDYHTSATCPGALSKYHPMTAFTYGELDTGIYASLNRCYNCHPPRRKADIEEINNLHKTQSPGMVSDYHQ